MGKRGHSLHSKNGNCGNARRGPPASFKRPPTRRGVAPFFEGKRMAASASTASVQSECLQWSLHALLSPLRLAIDSRAAGVCWFALREGWLRDHPEAIVALRAACDHSRLQPCQQLLSWSRRAKDVGTTNCIRPKAALGTATSTAQWSPARREAGVTHHVESPSWQCHALLVWPLALGCATHSGLEGSLEGQRIDVQTPRRQVLPC